MQNAIVNETLNSIIRFKKFFIFSAFSPFPSRAYTRTPVSRRRRHTKLFLFTLFPNCGFCLKLLYIIIVVGGSICTALAGAYRPVAHNFFTQRVSAHHVRRIHRIHRATRCTFGHRTNEIISLGNRFRLVWCKRRGRSYIQHFFYDTPPHTLQHLEIILCVATRSIMETELCHPFYRFIFCVLVGGARLVQLLEKKLFRFCH